MTRPEFTLQHRRLGQYASWAVFILDLLYVPVLILGFLSLKSPQDPIGDPYFSILELLIIILSPLMVVVMVAIHGYARPNAKAYSLIALAFMILLAGLTSCVHFTVLTVSHQIESAGFPWAKLFFSFTWPSVIYTLDLLAWDVFFPLSMLFAALIFTEGKLERAIRTIMIASAILSFAGLIGVALANMQYRNIGIIGYAGVATFAFLLLAILFGRSEKTARN
jgi:hypothetical protein